MNAKAIVRRINFPTDARGLVLEPLVGEEFPAQKNAHLVITAPGGIRGNHYHRVGHEIAVVLGPAFVRLRDADGLRELTIPPGEAYRFDLPAGVPHAMKNTGTEPMVILSFNTEVHDPASPDVVREVLI